jgi:hypothetical protein
VTPSECLDSIRAYTAAHKELREAHHFLFHLPLEPGNSKCEVMVISQNPGESPRQFESHPMSRAIELGLVIWEESSERDFMDPNFVGRLSPETGQDTVKWSKAMRDYCGTNDIIQSELFFWSSRDRDRTFRQRFGRRFRDSPHLEFCRRMNEELISLYQPKVVVTAGITDCEHFANLYGLQHRSTIRGQHMRLIEHFARDDIDWVFTAHWTGTYIGTADSAFIRAYIDAVRQGLSLPSAPPLDEPTIRKSAVRTPRVILGKTPREPRSRVYFRVADVEHLPKNRAVLEILRHWARLHPSASSTDLDAAFPRHLHPKGLFVEIGASAVMRDQLRWFTKDTEIITLADGAFVVTNQWGAGPAFERVLELARAVGIRVSQEAS